MNICFVNKTGESFSLGSVSFGILNENDVFDKFNEDMDERSETIFLCNGIKKCKGLAEAIGKMPREKGGTPYRADLLEKIDDFRQFVTQSKYLKATIR